MSRSSVPAFSNGRNYDHPVANVAGDAIGESPATTQILSIKLKRKKKKEASQVTVKRQAREREACLAQTQLRRD